MHLTEGAHQVFFFSRPSETKRQLPEVAQILANLVNRYRETAAAGSESYLLMARVFAEQLAEFGVEMVALSMPPKGYKMDRLVLEGFELDESGIVFKCPVGDAPLNQKSLKSVIGGVPESRPLCRD